MKKPAAKATTQRQLQPAQPSQSQYKSPFEAIRQENDEGNEYWSARDLAPLLSYTNWRNFRYAIDKAKIACQKSGQSMQYHFDGSIKMINLARGAKRKIEDYHLSRYACYLTIQNADPNKDIVALAQTYFAVKVQQQEASEGSALAALSEDQKRLAVHREMLLHNLQLAETTAQAGIISPEDFAVFQDHGYAGLYGGLKSADIHQRKGLQEGQQIIDHMGSEELIANLFRASQTASILQREQVQDQTTANHTHQQIGQKIRALIEDVGGTRPENLATPDESIRQLEQKARQKKRQIGQ